MVPGNNRPLDEHCTRFHTCGVMRQAGLRVRDSGDYFASASGTAQAPRERFVTITGQLIGTQPAQSIRIVVAEAFIACCADENATSRMKCLGLSSARVAISAEQRYTISGLTRHWCTTTYVLHIYLDDREPIRHSIQLQGIESINKREAWQPNYEIELTH